MSLFPGFNTNIRHKNKIFHIQTEVLSTGDRNTISTLIYMEGRIFHSIKNPLKPEEAVHRETAGLAIMRQHKEAIKKLISNQLVAADAAAAPRGTFTVVDFTELYQEKRLFSIAGLAIPNLKNVIAELMIETE